MLYKYTGVRVIGSGTVVRTLDLAREGAVVAVMHFNTESASLLVYATQVGPFLGLCVCFFMMTSTGRVRSQPCMFIFEHPQKHTQQQKGRVHCWDLRTDTEAWVLQAPPELGYLTALALGT